MDAEKPTTSTVIDGGEAIVGEIAETATVRANIAGEFRAFLETPAFLDAYPGYLLPDPASQERLPILEGRITKIPLCKIHAFHNPLIF